MGRRAAKVSRSMEWPGLTHTVALLLPWQGLWRLDGLVPPAEISARTSRRRLSAANRNCLAGFGSGERWIGVMSVMCPYAPSLVGRVHAVEGHQAGWDRREGEQLSPTDVRGIKCHDPVGIRPNIGQVISRLHSGGGHVTGKEQEPGEPQDAVDEGRDAFVEANAPLHPRPM